MRVELPGKGSSNIEPMLPPRVCVDVDDYVFEAHGRSPNGRLSWLSPEVRWSTASDNL
jgi:hypothetical protein